MYQSITSVQHQLKSGFIWL